MIIYNRVWYWKFESYLITTRRDERAVQINRIFLTHVAYYFIRSKIIVIVLLKRNECVKIFAPLRIIIVKKQVRVIVLSDFMKIRLITRQQLNYIILREFNFAYRYTTLLLCTVMRVINRIIHRLIIDRRSWIRYARK